MIAGLRTVAAVLAAVALAFAAVAAGMYLLGVPPARQPTPSPTVTCVEDMPCWDCSAMGNRICGPLRSV
jgi:hypothetical protein